MDWIAMLVGHPKDLEDSADPVNLAEGYVLSRNMHAGTSTTLKKAMRARRIAINERGVPDSKPPPMRLPPARRSIAIPRSLVRQVVMADIEHRGVVRRRPYLHVVDHSRYPPERLREMRRNRTHR